MLGVECSHPIFNSPTEISRPSQLAAPGDGRAPFLFFAALQDFKPAKSSGRSVGDLGRLRVQLRGLGDQRRLHGGRRGRAGGQGRDLGVERRRLSRDRWGLGHQRRLHGRERRLQGMEWRRAIGEPRRRHRRGRHGPDERGRDQVGQRRLERAGHGLGGLGRTVQGPEQGESGQRQQRPDGFVFAGRVHDVIKGEELVLVFDGRARRFCFGNNLRPEPRCRYGV